MKNHPRILAIATLFFAIVFSACNSNAINEKKEKSDAIEAIDTEHDREEHGGEGEESGTLFGLDEVYDEVRKGTHLILSYDKASNSFNGTVENVSDEPLDRVRVEVHLSNGKELGPTMQVKMEPGEKRNIILEAESDDFSSWATHAELGSGEHSHENGQNHSHENGNEHSHEDEHEHSHEGDSHEHN